jgi:hypothetical protein
MADRERTPLNAPGPFYTEEDVCMSCGAPEAEAPDLMAFDAERGSCYFRRQPATPDELAQAIQAVCVACCHGVHYAGNDAEVLAELQRRSPNRFRPPLPPGERRQPWARP